MVDGYDMGGSTDVFSVCCNTLVFLDCCCFIGLGGYCASGIGADAGAQTGSAGADTGASNTDETRNGAHAGAYDGTHDRAQTAIGETGGDDDSD